MTEEQEAELESLRALRQRIIDLTNEAWSMSQQPVGFQAAQRYAAIAGALTMLLDPPATADSGASALPAIHLTK